MSECAICGRPNCFPMGHSAQEQREFVEVIKLFKEARQLREAINNRLDAEVLAAERLREEGET